MKTKLPAKAAKLLRELVGLLIEGQYEELEQRSESTKVTARGLSKAVDDYRRTLIELPEEGWELTDVVTLQGSPPTRFSVRQPLWTREEGRSDLTFEATFIKVSENQFDFEINDLHVL